MNDLRFEDQFVRRFNNTESVGDIRHPICEDMALEMDLPVQHDSELTQVLQAQLSCGHCVRRFGPIPYPAPLIPFKDAPLCMEIAPRVSDS